MNKGMTEDEFRLPTFITFTGYDDRTDGYYGPEKFVNLAITYPIEYGILFSRSNSGKKNRYPTGGTIRRFLKEVSPHAKLSAHLCGEMCREVLSGQMLPLGFSWDRVQFNAPEYSGTEIKAVLGATRSIGLEAIFQTRMKEAFPYYSLGNTGFWLYDASGGEGKHPDQWPVVDHRSIHPNNLPLMVGYAGGINPDNVADTIVAINETYRKKGLGRPMPYWLDMESGVRDEYDFFCPKRIQKVCETVYGEFL